MFPLASEEEGEGGDDIPILYTRMVKETGQKEEEELEPITNPFYGELPSPGFTDSEGEAEEAEHSGLCEGCGARLELTCTRPSRSEPCPYPPMPELYPGEDRYLRLQRKLRSEGKAYDEKALKDSARREHEWIEFHLDRKREEKKESEADQVRMVRADEFYDVAEWFVMDDTDGDDDWCVIGETNAPDVVRAVQTEERVPEESLELIILDSGSDASLLPCDHPKAGKVNSGNTGVVLGDAQGNQIKSAGIVTAVIDIEQGDCGTAPSISENFIVSEATNILLSMGRILKNGWRLEYDPRISAEEQTSGAQHYLTVSSMVLVSPDGRAKARIFYKRNSCCLLGRISVVGSGTGSAPRQGNSRSSTGSWTAVERSVSVKVPEEFTELLDSTPNGKWTIMDDGTPFIVYQATTFIDPQDGFPGWKWRTTMLGEGGSEWSVVELYSDYAANRSHNVQIPECYGATKHICTILHACVLVDFAVDHKSRSMGHHGRGTSAEVPGGT